MTTLTAKTIGQLIKKDRVHGSIYTDPDIFDMEMDRIFGHAWVFVGHDSQVPEVGDFVTTFIGKQPVVMVRHTDGKIGVLYNRCGHRGAVVENLPKGNAKHFRCCYHGWVFKTNGELASVPLKNGYPENFDLSNPQLGMVPVASVDSYRGFVFARCAPKGPALEKALIGARTGIDDICNRSPDGEVEFAGGAHKYLYKGNWKFQIENIVDNYHPVSSHASTLDKDVQFRRRDGDSGGINFENSDIEGVSPLDAMGVWGFDYGHSAIGSPVQRERSGPVYDEYKRRLVKRYGAKRTEEIIAYNRHNTGIYPNLIIQALNVHARVVRPISPDATEVTVYPIKFKGAPEEMFKSAIRHLNVTHSPASMVQTDDLECFKRCQDGLGAHGSDWVVLARGSGTDKKDPKMDGMAGFGTSELGMRHQVRAWKKYMSAAG